jgi:uncharacterized protein YbcC (UPF0753/DUF2309 family)
MLYVFSRIKLSSILLVGCFAAMNSLASINGTTVNAPATALTTVVPTVASTSTKSYLEWKSSKILEIENRVKSLRKKMVSQAVARPLSSKDPNLLNKLKTEAGLRTDLQDQLDQELLNLSISQDLSISDYFVGYLTKQPSLDSAIKDVSGRLTAEEVAELMEAFAHYFFQTRSSGSKMAPRADSSWQ